jgi:hypothetical protein
MADTGHTPADSAAGSLHHPPLDEIRFAHSSERVAAEILDFYRIRWLYEPRRFPIEWDGKGNVIAYFTPDFYLVDFDLYIELTTMSQKLVTKKNRKVRQVRALHPEVRCKIFYQRDYLHLLVKYGLDAGETEGEPPLPSRLPGPPQVVSLSGVETG